MTASPTRARSGSFAEATALAFEGPGRFEADVHPGWTIGGRPNGGYLTAMLAQAAIAVSRQPHAVAASAHFLRPPEPGRATVEAELVRGGRAVDQVRCRLAQGGTPCVEAVITTGSLEQSPADIWGGGLPAPSRTAFEHGVPARPVMPDGTRVTILEHVDLRLDPDSTGFTRGEPSGRGELRGWLRLPHDETFDTTSLVFAVDSFPPASFDVLFTGWVPTLELTAYVRALPSPGPVQVLQQARLIAGGRVDEACFVWDAEGRLVAQGTQLAAVRPA